MRNIKVSSALRLSIAGALTRAFLVFHVARYLGETVLAVPAVTMFLSSLLLGLVLERSRLRLLPAAALFAALTVAARGILFLLFRLYQSHAPSPEADFLFFRFDSTFIPLLVPLCLVWLFTFLSNRYRSFAVWECGINTLFFGALFWSQAGFDIGLYSHPAFLAAAALLFIFLQVVILLETTPWLRLRRAGSRRKVGSLAWIAVPVLLLFFLFMYNLYTREAVSHGGGLIKPTMFRFDFSRYVRLESEISLDDDLVMLVRKEGGPDSALLRRFILSGYREGAGFFYEAEPKRQGFRTAVPDSPVLLNDPGYEGREDVLQEYYIVNFDPSSLIAMNYPVRITPLINWDESSFLRIYRVESRVSGFLPFELSDCPEPETVMDRDLYDYYTRYGGDSAVRDLAVEITAGADTCYERVVALESYLLDNYFYSLKPGVADDGNQLHHFLFESGKGYCSYFAFAMALMARSIGIPARVAVGFFTDPGAEVFHYYPVRADMAHAWVEIFFPGYGWIEFDPTSTVIAPGEEYRFGDMDMQEVSSLIEEILKNRYQLREEEGVQENGETGGVKWFRRTMEGLRRVVSLWYLVLPGLYLFLCLVFRLYPVLRVASARDRRRKVKRLFSSASAVLRSLGLPKKPGETVGEYSERLDARYGIAMVPFTGMYLKAVFAAEFESADLEESLMLYRELRSSIRSSFSPGRRCVGWINPFGLGRIRI